MRTAVTDMFAVEFPIFAFSHCRDVVAEVSKAGGLGVLGAITHTPDELDLDLRWLVEELDGAPFGVDVLLPHEHSIAAATIPDAHRGFVRDMLAGHGIQLPTGEEATQFASAQVTQITEDLLDVAFEYPLALVASALGPPTEALVARARDRGVKVAALAGTVEHATRHVATGVDVVVAQGHEAGGHTGEIATMVLVPEVVDAVAPVPVLAAGGIGRGRQVAAALALGAQGVWCGSVWLGTEEAETSPVVKEKFFAARSQDTVRSPYRTGKPARQLKSAWTEAWLADGAPPPLPMHQQIELAEGALRHVEKLAESGNGAARELVTYYVGQIVGSMDRIRTTRQVMFDLVDELVDTLGSMGHLLHEAEAPTP